jgi:hypothetical protein
MLHWQQAQPIIITTNLYAIWTANPSGGGGGNSGGNGGGSGGKTCTNGAVNYPRCSVNQDGTFARGTLAKFLTPYQHHTIYVVKGKKLKLPFEAVGHKSFKGLVRIKIYQRGVLKKIKKSKKVTINQAQTFDIKGKKVGGTSKIRIAAAGKQLIFTVKVVKEPRPVRQVRLTVAPQSVSLAAFQKDKVYALQLALTPRAALTVPPKFSLAKKYRRYLKVDQAGRLHVRSASTSTVPVKVQCGAKSATIKIRVTK